MKSALRRIVVLGVLLLAVRPALAQEAPPAAPGAATAPAPAPFGGVEPIPESELATWRSMGASLLRKVTVLNLLLSTVVAEGGSAQARVEALRSATTQKAAALRGEAAKLVGAAGAADLSAKTLDGAAAGVAAVAATATTAGQQAVGGIFAGLLNAMAESDQKAAAQRREKAQQLVAEAGELEGKLADLQGQAEKLSHATSESTQRLRARRDYLHLLARAMTATAQSEDLRRKLADLADRQPQLESAFQQVITGTRAP